MSIFDMDLAGFIGQMVGSVALVMVFHPLFTFLFIKKILKTERTLKTLNLATLITSLFCEVVYYAISNLSIPNIAISYFLAGILIIIIRTIKWRIKAPQTQ